jgi:hypothetical protein
MKCLLEPGELRSRKSLQIAIRLLRALTCQPGQRGNGVTGQSFGGKSMGLCLFRQKLATEP